MIKPLRRRHLQIWTVIAVLLPAGILVSWLVIPNSVPVKTLSAPAIALLPEIRAKKETDQYCIYVRSNATKTEWQLEWKNRLALTVPSAVIYKVSASSSEASVPASFNPAQAELIGRIEAKGDYVFPLPADSANSNDLHLVLYDFIHDRKIDTITFINFR